MVRTLELSSTDLSKAPRWEVLGGPVSNVVATCAVDGNQPHIWTPREKGVAHNFQTVNGNWNVTGRGEWSIDANFKTRIQPSRPAVVCQDSNETHNMVMYGMDGAVRHSQSPGDVASWRTPTFRGGKFIGDPAVAVLNWGYIHFFGIGEDRRMYTFSWTTTGGYTELQDAGGPFESVPSALASSWGADVEVVVLSMTNRVLHRTMNGPLLANMTGNKMPERVGVFVVGLNGEVIQKTVAWGLERWKDPIWRPLKGKMTTEFHVANSTPADSRSF